MSEKSSVTALSVKKENKVMLNLHGKTFRIYHEGYILRKKNCKEKKKFNLKMI